MQKYVYTYMYIVHMYHQPDDLSRLNEILSPHYENHQYVVVGRG